MIMLSGGPGHRERTRQSVLLRARRITVMERVVLSVVLAMVVVGCSASKPADPEPQERRSASQLGDSEPDAGEPESEPEAPVVEPEPAPEPEPEPEPTPEPEAPVEEPSAPTTSLHVGGQWNVIATYNPTQPFAAPCAQGAVAPALVTETWTVGYDEELVSVDRGDGVASLVGRDSVNGRYRLEDQSTYPEIQIAGVVKWVITVTNDTFEGTAWIWSPEAHCGGSYIVEGSLIPEG